ncbi:LysM peptidoglycan-binding domain-containing C40 family peptidase [Streptomyces sp. MI02-2A]|uniref:C40 family peptidase n=1 Tax=Streptomyces sp. MI02-2A TaxID=3028688 RepID=UPI0029C07C8D|nr:LysM peptidoglycan-binding domain-containing C40 family peptidase [Streptomyces sp. MI02-2A]
MPVWATPASASSPAYVTVRKGDTLSGIASKHHTTWQHLAAVNHIANPNKIRIGQHIYLSGSHGATTKPSKPKPKPSKVSSGTKIVNQAAKYRGTPYVYGGTTKKGMDCSGLTQTTLKALGKKIPRVAADQYRSSKKVSKPQKGDFVFVHDSHGVYHVAIYVNSKTWLEAERPGKGVNYYKPWSRSVYYGRYTVK